MLTRPFSALTNYLDESLIWESQQKINSLTKDQISQLYYKIPPRIRLEDKFSVVSIDLLADRAENIETLLEQYLSEGKS